MINVISSIAPCHMSPLQPSRQQPLLSGCPVITLSTTRPSRCLTERCRYLIASMRAQSWPHPISSTSPLPSFRPPHQIDGSGLQRYPLCVCLALRIRIPCLPSSGGEGSADHLAREALIPFVTTRFSTVHAQWRPSSRCHLSTLRRDSNWKCSTQGRSRIDIDNGKQVGTC